MVNLRIIGGKIRQEKKYHFKCIWLVFWGLIGETNLKGQRGEKREAIHVHEREKNLAAPFQENSSNSHAISSLFQVFIMSIKCPRSNPK